MRLIKYFSIVVLTLLVSSITVSAQNARLRFENLNGLEKKASDLVEVNVDGKMLSLAKRVLVKVNDKDARKIGEAIKGLEGVYVRVFNFANDNEYDVADIEQIRSQLDAPGWEKLAKVRSKKDDQKIDVYTMFSGDDISGVAVILSEKRKLALVNVIGPIDIDTLVKLSGNLHIPEFGIEDEKDAQKKNKE